MELTFLKEPELDFGTGKHIDIRFGLMNYGPLDFALANAPKVIRLGMVGTNQTMEGLATWLEKCRDGIPAKESSQPNLFPRFPGCRADVGLRCSLVTEARFQRTVPSVELQKVQLNPSPNQLVTDAVDLFVQELSYLVSKTAADVLLACVPDSLLDAMDPEFPKESEEADDEERQEGNLNFHHLLKARCMELSKPIQIVLPTTYTGAPRKGKRNPRKTRPLQDEATRAWNLHTAIYYKANGVPWRMVRDATQLTTCYIGISFFKTLDESEVHTSLAQVFNERGEGVIVCGPPAQVAKEDRQPHLSGKDAHDLLIKALEQYRLEHGNLPARMVVHKTSRYTEDERSACVQAAYNKQIHSLDLLVIDRSKTRLFRMGIYPPLRGTFLTLDGSSHRLYSRGSVDFFSTYPGKYVPRSLDMGCEAHEQTPRFLAKEILALSKMNWNNTQFDGFYPITVRAAREVGKILKYVRSGGRIQSRYSYYM